MLTRVWSGPKSACSGNDRFRAQFTFVLTARNHMSFSRVSRRFAGHHARSRALRVRRAIIGSGESALDASVCRVR